MCGFAGALELGVDAAHWGRRLAAMGDAVRHRGPDDVGVWCDPVAGVGLAHRRLAVLDPSPAGHQPMISRDGRWVIAYNGEVYNFESLRRELRGVAWRGSSDTEVLLAAFEAWGVEAAVRRFNGMFAFALLDRREGVVWLGRDRVGIKPLYYGRCGDVWLFGSQPAALVAHPAFDAGIEPASIGLLLRFGYIPAPATIYRGVHKLLPGTLARFSLRATAVPDEPGVARYWSLGEVAVAGREQPFEGDARAALDALEACVERGVTRRLVSDVPLGAFLSGGIDSSLVVALMRKNVQRVRTFSIGFAEEGYDEADHARAVAAHLGTEHVERTVRPEDARALIPDLPSTWDEPFADPSQIPMCLVSSLAREQVTVSLSGDGGDELFGGYKRYAAGRDLWALLRRVPVGARAVGAGLLQRIPRPLLDGVLGRLGPQLARYGRAGRTGDKLHKLAEVLPSADLAALYAAIVSLWRVPQEVVRGLAESPPRDGKLVFPIVDAWPQDGDPTARMMFVDTQVYLPDDILTKVDRASMRVGLEARVPLLDHETIAFAWSLPPALRLREEGSKWPLRALLERHVPAPLIDRPKMGFGAPVGRWLRGPLRDWAEDLLDEGRLGREGYLVSRKVRERWGEHLRGDRDWGAALWAVLMFEAWLDAR